MRALDVVMALLLGVVVMQQVRRVRQFKTDMLQAQWQDYLDAKRLPFPA